MATEYKDGTFGETLPIDDAMKEFIEAVEDGTAKALHVGSFDEVAEEKAKTDFKRDIQKSMEELSKRVKDLEADDSIIKPATPEQIAKVLKDGINDRR